MSEKMNAQVLHAEKILDRVDRIIEEGGERDRILLSVCRLLEKSVEVFDWVGFYLVDPEAERELVLGPYVGEETDHVRIPFGRGICGQAAESRETFVVQDVSQASNYLSCSAEVEAEIVVPVMKDGNLMGELDIDSHTRDSITSEHRRLVEAVCGRVAPLFQGPRASD